MGWYNVKGLQVASLSPELFLEKRGERIETEPMKGTARRMPNASDDEAMKEWLAADPKNRAENVMIVDMCRNDLGRICLPSSVKTPELFAVRSYPSVHQLVSRVAGVLPDACGLPDILKACFPPASITGAPKIMAMKRIAELESSPRKLYTGCFGGVARRRLHLQRRHTESALRGNAGGARRGRRHSGRLQPWEEWDECLAKASFATEGVSAGTFKLIETILWRRDSGLQLAELHKRRAERSQRALGRRWDEDAYGKALKSLPLENGGSDFARIRLLISEDGATEASATPLPAPGWGKDAIKVLLSSKRVDSRRRLSRHKSTARKLYDAEFKRVHGLGFDEVLFMNEREELVEGAISNLLLKTRDGREISPDPELCGALPGVWMESLLESREIEKTRVSRGELLSALKIELGNSVRGGARVAELWEESESGVSTLLWSDTAEKQPIPN
jgi:para-aminobenzoate synthetase/4-amino-4-deoxychorismate lyase